MAEDRDKMGKIGHLQHLLSGWTDTCEVTHESSFCQYHYFLTRQSFQVTRHKSYENP
jgi:hypothetical protein